MPSSINPYQPPTPSSPQTAPTSGIAFRVTSRDLRHGESHYLIRCRPYMVTLVSVVMILLCTAVILYAVTLRTPFALRGIGPVLVLPALLTASAMAYLFVVRQPKNMTRRELQSHGIAANTMISIDSLPEVLRVQCNDDVYEWPQSNVVTYRTPRGLLIVPQPYLFLFVPRRGAVDRDRYRMLVNSLHGSGADVSE